MEQPKRILILCTGNSCRSQMAEALLRHRAGGRLQVASAGSHPAGYIHPLATETMRRLKVPMGGQYSKSWDDFAHSEIDIVITVCDHAAACPNPSWEGGPVITHWSLPDPTYAAGDTEERLAAAAEVARKLQEWFDRLLALPLADLSREQLQVELDRIPHS